jgi:N-acyl-D-amino-acid deacylase
MKPKLNLLTFLPALLLLVSCGTIKTNEPSDLDLVLIGGTVYTGENSEPIVTDIWIKDDQIVGMGQFGNVPAKLVLDVSGLAVMPGFIDLHTHVIRNTEAGSGIFRWPDAENLIRQGNTTVIGCVEQCRLLPLSKYFDRLEANPAAVNYGSFISLGPIRKKIIGLEDRPPNDEELEDMKQEVEKAMHEGAFGLSTGLVYVPETFTETDEIIELAKVAGRNGGIYISHMRDENLGVLESVTELIRIAEEANLPGQITHAKVMGAAMQGRSIDMLAMVDEAVARGVDITLDQYPYTAGKTGLTVQFPRWSRDGGNSKIKERLQNPEMREKIKQELIYQLTYVRGRNDPANVQFALCNFDHSINGLNLSQLLIRQSREVTIENAAELIIELQLQGGCEAIYHAMHDDDVVKIMQHPRTMIASDGAVEFPGNAFPHPRTYGSFSRVLGHYSRERGVIPVHTAIHKMTVMPADRIGLKDRGRIAPGMIADIAVLDLDRVKDLSTFEDPHQYSEGAVHVFVAGEAVLLNGEMTGARPGRVLRSSSYEGDQ